MFSILRISASAPQPSSAPYNQFTLPLLAKGYNISFCSLSSAKIPVPENLNNYGAENSILRFYKIIRRLVRTQKYDIIHIHHLNVFIIFFVATFLNKKSLLKQSVLTLHTSYHLLSLRNRVLFFVCLMGVQRVICCSGASYRSLPSFYRKHFSKKINIIPNGFDDQGIDQVNKLSLLEKGRTFRILSVGRLIEGKNPEVIIKSFLNLDIENAELVFVGDGPMREYLMKETERLGMKGKVIFTGILPRHEVYKWMCSSDIYISTSQGEGMPIAVLEAMYCGCFAILSKIPPHLEIDQGLSVVRFIEEPYERNINEQIKAFYAFTENEKKALIQKSISHIYSQYSLNTMLNSYLSIYNQLLPKSKV